MYNFLKKLPLFKQVYRRGGIDSFALAQKDILETMRDDLDAQVEELAKKKVHDLYVPVNLTDVITMDKRGLIFIGGEQVDETRLANLYNEATALLQFDLWKVIHQTPRALAEKAMFQEDGTIDNQLIKGRAVIYTLDSQKKILDLLNNVQIKK